MVRTMIDALDQQMNSSIALAFQSEGAMDAYVCETLMACADMGDYVDRNDVRAHIGNQRAAEAVIRVLDEKGIK